MSGVRERVREAGEDELADAIAAVVVSDCVVLQRMRRSTRFCSPRSLKEVSGSVTSMKLLLPSRWTGLLPSTKTWLLLPWMRTKRLGRATVI